VNYNDDAGIGSRPNPLDFVDEDTGLDFAASRMSGHLNRLASRSTKFGTLSAERARQSKASHIKLKKNQT